MIELPPPGNAGPDEKFWREREKGLTRQIGQPCCSLSGMASLLSDMPGRFAVVIHGEADCVNSFAAFQGASSGRFYSSRVSQVEFASGRAGRPLERCLELVIKHRRPEAVFVLSTCLMEMIHDDLETPARRAQERSGVPVAALHTSGLKAGSQAEMIDWLYSTLAALPPSGAPGRPEARPSVNLIGLPPLFEGAGRASLERLLAAAGAELNGLYPFDASLEDWRRIGRARASFVVDPSLYPRLLGRLASLGQDAAEVPLPVGIGPSLSFLRAVAGRFGREAELERAAQEEIGAARARLAAFKSKFGPLRVAVGLRMVNNYRADQLAYDGLGDLTLFEEAGFRLSLFIQGPPDEAARRHFRARLDQLGCALPFTVFADPFDLPSLLKAGRFDLAYLADHAKGEARKAGVPLLRGRCLEPFFDGMLRNLERLDAMISDLRRRGAGA